MYVPGVLTPVNENVPWSGPDALEELNVNVPSVSTRSTLPSGPPGPTTTPLTEPAAACSSTATCTGLPSADGVMTNDWVS